MHRLFFSLFFIPLATHALCGTGPNGRTTATFQVVENSRYRFSDLVALTFGLRTCHLRLKTLDKLVENKAPDEIEVFTEGRTCHFEEGYKFDGLVVRPCLEALTFPSGLRDFAAVQKVWIIMSSYEVNKEKQTVDLYDGYSNALSDSYSFEDYRKATMAIKTLSPKLCVGLRFPCDQQVLFAMFPKLQRESDRQFCERFSATEFGRANRETCLGHLENQIRRNGN